MSRSMDSAWSALQEELDAWAEASTAATFWWRDDDAVKPGESLQRLIDLTADTGLLLAVIPARVSAELADKLIDYSHVQVAQHGYAHINHAPRGQGLGAWELGLHRGEAAVLADLSAGRKRLEECFGSDFLPVIVPPWNRIAPELLSPLAIQGYRGVSAFGIREQKNHTANLTLANAHCDPIRWKDGARFAGIAKTLSQLVNHLKARRTGRTDMDEHTGFLTHHLDMDRECWDFCSTLMALLSSHDAAQWVSSETVFNIDS